jgi:hypothetical protein
LGTGNEKKPAFYAEFLLPPNLKESPRREIMLGGITSLASSVIEKLLDLDTRKSPFCHTSSYEIIE